jgi:hypothetical protein
MNCYYFLLWLFDHIVAEDDAPSTATKLARFHGEIITKQHTTERALF